MQDFLQSVICLVILWKFSLVRDGLVTTFVPTVRVMLLKSGVYLAVIAVSFAIFAFMLASSASATGRSARSAKRDTKNIFFIIVPPSPYVKLAQVYKTSLEKFTAQVHNPFQTRMQAMRTAARAF